MTKPNLKHKIEDIVSAVFKQLKRPSRFPEAMVMNKHRLCAS